MGAWSTGNHFGSSRIMAIGCAALIWLAGGLALEPRPANAKEVVKIAFIGPLSGGVAANGLGGRNSADLAVRLQNREAHSKYQYELVVLDDECKPNVGVQVATRAAADRSIIAGITHYCSTVAVATVDTYHRFGLPVVVWGSVLPAVTYAHNYKEIHRVNGTMIDGDKAAAKFMRELGYRTWVIIHDTTDYGRGHLEYFSKPLKENGGEILGTFGVPVEQQDFTAELIQAKALNPEVVYFGGLTPLGVRVRSQMEKVGLNAQFQGTGGILSDAYISALGPVADGTLAYEFGAPIEKLLGGQQFLHLYKEQGYGDPPEILGPYAFVAAKLIMDTIEKVGPDRKSVLAALNATKDYGSIIGPVNFDDHRQNIIVQNTLYVVQDGKWVVWEDSEYFAGKRKLKKR